MASGPWVPPDGTDANGVILKFIVLWVDYRENPGSLGGQLFMMLCERPNAASNWALGEAVFLYEEVITGALTNAQVFMHFHNAAATFPGTGQTANKIVVTLSVGDAAPNNRLVNITREDYSTYDEGWPTNPPDQPTAARPTPTDRFPPQPITQNGWTTYEEREGQRVRIAFSDGQYISGTPNLIASAAGAFQNYTQPTGGGVTPLVLTGGLEFSQQVLGVTGKDASNRLQLNRAIIGNVTGPLTGYIWSDSSIQGVPNMPSADPKTVIFGADESGNSVYKYTVNNPAERIDPALVHGVMTDQTNSYTTPNDNADRCLGWVALVSAFRHEPGAITPTDYAILASPNAFAPWQTDPRAQTLLYSPDGNTWGEMFAPDYSGDLAVPSAFFGSDVYLGRDNEMGLYSTPRPRMTGSTSRAISARPLVISGGGTNLLRRYQIWSAIEAIEIFNGPGGSNYATAAGRSSSPPEVTLADPNINESVPLPPCTGPIMRFGVVDHPLIGLFKLTNGLTFASLPRVRLRLFLYRLPSAKPLAGENVMPTSCPSFFGMRLRLVPEGVDPGSSHPDIRISPRYLLPASIAGKGWTPVTLHFDFGSMTDPPTMPDYEVYAEVQSGTTGFSRQDILTAWDYVVAADGTLELPQRSLALATQGPPEVPVVSPGESLSIVTTNPQPSSQAWTVFVAFRVPDSGPDVFTENRVVSSSSLTVCTLRESSSKYLRVVIDRGNFSANDLKIIDHAGTAWTIPGPASGDDGINLAQPFFFLRGRQVLMGISRYDSGGGVYRYRAWVSVGGTRVKVAVDTATPLAGVIPKSFKTGDPNGVNVDPAEFFGLWMDDANSLSEADGKAKLWSLDWLT